MVPSLPDFFETVTGKAIMPYQEEYGRDPFTHTLLRVPTGLGKTDTVLVPWMHRVACNDMAVPRRLVFTLPRQNLTKQIAEVARDRVGTAGLTGRVAVHELMGGSSDNRHTIAPDQHAILVGTQDILIRVTNHLTHPAIRRIVELWKRKSQSSRAV